MTWLDRLRNNVVLVTVLLYVLFNWGFMQLRIPPVAGSGLPLAETVLLLSLMTINYTGVLGRLSLTVAMVPLGIWWTFGVGRALFDFGMHGTWALRDAAHVLESLFLLVGFVFAGDQKSLERFFNGCRRSSSSASSTACSIRSGSQIWQLSPTITSGTGFNVPILGSMTNTPQIMLIAAFYLLLFHGNRFAAKLVAALVIGYVLAMFQARTNYQDPDRRVRFSRCSAAAPVISNSSFIACLSVYPAGAGQPDRRAVPGPPRRELRARVPGRALHGDLRHLRLLGAEASARRWMASTSVSTGGPPPRADEAGPVHLLFGLGYGEALTDFYGAAGAAVREPHNCYLTMFARTGIVGAICWLLIMLSLIRRWHRPS